jgi:hypothetical protein
MFGKMVASLLLVVLIAGGFTFWRIAHRQRAERGMTASDQFEGDSQQSEPAKPQSRAKDPEMPRPAPAIEQHDTAQTPVASADPNPSTPPKLKLTYDQYRNQLQAAFDAESVDWNWSAAAGTRLAENLAAKLPAGSTLGVVQCRATMCRVTARHQSAEALEHFRDEIVFLTREDWTGGGLIMAEGQNNLGTVAFLGRSGTFLPEPVERSADPDGT